MQPQASFRDLRLWAGISLLIFSIAVGHIVLSNASARSTAWMLKTDLAQGSTVRQQDIQAVKVALPSDMPVLTDSAQILGKTLTRNMFTGDVLASHDVTSGTDLDVRLVTIPVRAGHVPPVQYGDLVDVWMSASSSSVAVPQPTHLVAQKVLVHQAPEVLDPSTDTSLTLLVKPQQVAQLVQASQEGLIDIVIASANGATE